MVQALCERTSGRSEPRRLQCSEIWGGVRNADCDVCTRGLTVSVFSEACGGDTGGDIYYVAVCADDSLTRIALADVRGHGSEVSGISSWVYRSLLKKMNSLDGAGVLCDLNARLYRRGLDAITTASVAGYYRAQSNLDFSYAGHPPALVCRGAIGEWQPLRLMSNDGPANISLGVLASAHFDQEHTALETGDRLLLYTDGVIECADQRGEEFGEERLVTVLNEAAGESLAQVKRRVVDALRRHAAPGMFQDDVTLLAAEVNG